MERYVISYILSDEKSYDVNDLVCKEKTYLFNIRGLNKDLCNLLHEHAIMYMNVKNHYIAGEICRTIYKLENMSGSYTLEDISDILNDNYIVGKRYKICKITSKEKDE